MAQQLSSSRFRVVLRGLAPAYEAGLAPALAARGGVVDKPKDVGAWLAAGDHRVLVIAADHREFASAVGGLRATAPTAPVMALLDGFSFGGLVAALRAGASTAGDALVDLDTLATKIEAAAARWASLPFEALDELRELTRHGNGDIVLSPDEQDLLRALAQAGSMRMIADRLHMSERTAYRKTHRVYEKLGVATRVTAVAVACRSGLLE